MRRRCSGSRSRRTTHTTPTTTATTIAKPASAWPASPATRSKDLQKMSPSTQKSVAQSPVPTML